MARDPGLHQAVAAEEARHKRMFGVVVGTQDDGKYTRERPLPGTAVGDTTYNGAAGSRPVFHGAHPNAIKLAQMNDNYDKAMAGMLQQPPDNARQTEGLVDTGMGRLSDGVERPVHTWVDETIRKK